MVTLALGIVTFGIWLYLLLGRSFFWLEKPGPSLPDSSRHPPVAVVVPARNEAELIGSVIESLLSQDYAGHFHIFLVDDHSTDGTAERAARAAAQTSRAGQFSVIGA